MLVLHYCRIVILLIILLVCCDRLEEHISNKVNAGSLKNPKVVDLVPTFILVVVLFFLILCLIIL